MDRDKNECIWLFRAKNIIIFQNKKRGVFVIQKKILKKGNIIFSNTLYFLFELIINERIFQNERQINIFF